MSRLLVIVESPYAGAVEANIEYARRCVLDSLKRGEAPLASHLLYTQMLDDTIPAERSMGIEAGLAWMPRAHKVAIYLDRGESNGMIAARAFAEELNLPIEERWLGEQG